MKEVFLVDGMKQCTGCGVWKPYTKVFFASKKATKSGLSSKCLKCVAHNKREYYKRNPEVVKAAVKKWEINNREKYLKVRKDSRKRRRDKERMYAIANRERLAEATRRWRKRNPRSQKDRDYERERYRLSPEAKIAAASKYQKKHPEKKSAINHKRRSILRGAEKHHTAREWEELKMKYQRKCLRCGKREPKIRLTKDHVVSLSRGGSNGIENIQPLCFQCNSSKGNHNQIDYRK